MEQIVEKITQDLLQKLPGQAQAFTPDELHSYGIPYVVVETLHKNVASTVDSELKTPESEWLQLNHESVQTAWRDFVEISKQNLQIPGSKLSILLTEAVEQCLELAVKPRQSVPEIIFRTHEVIDLQTARERVGSIEVNKQLAVALLRYMEKKEKEEITIEQARDLIKKVDERLVENFHPLKWAQSLKPVFDLAGPMVNTELFRIFFEDKEKPAYARKFDLLEEQTIDEAKFIEMLSSADVLDVEGYEDEQPELFVSNEKETEPEKVVEIDETPDQGKVILTGEEENPEEITEEDEGIQAEDYEAFDAPEKEGPFEEDQPGSIEDREYVYEEVSEEEKESEDDLPEAEEDEDEREENIINLFSKISDDDLFEEAEDDSEPVISLVDKEDDHAEGDNITLLTKFMFDESTEGSTETAEEESKTSEPSPKQEPTSIYEEMNLVQDDGTKSRENQDVFEEQEEDEQGDENEALSFKIETPEEDSDQSVEQYPLEKEQINNDLEEEGEDQPMWRSFLERDDLETDSGYEYEDESVEAYEDEDDGFIEEPIYDLTTDKPDPEEKIREISGWLDDEKDRFVDEIFRGSEFAYEQALAEIMDFENWKAASMYLENEVFSRNKIDVYDEVAVDFTDRLHSYFLENNSKPDD